MRRARRAAPAVLLALAVALTGCTTSGVQRDPAAPSAPAQAPRSPAAAPEEVREARVAAGIADCPVPDADAAARPDGLPDLVLPCLGEDAQVSLAQLRGRPLMVNVWASWCAPCRQEAPYLAEVAGSTQQELLVLGLVYEDADELAAVEVARASDQRYPHLVDRDGSISQPLRVPGPPVTFFVTADGRLVHTKVGPFSGTEEIRGLLREHLRLEA
ncbi:redoxin family protein [Auraticoccus sp. F435]|uniref:Redoxin family protein n=1 Tax=Auraticoccus cholistanensis TaxID=2656650 RepID=A0A6A9UYF3_9ACTN|nr:TlpA disulfide reductase family protein [Auraticoccus cholistanensis]MVA76925.1 redoxin family protein [Auraticoccus cholistanensis]